MAIDAAAAVGRLMEFLAVRGPTGEEAKVAAEVRAALKAAGVAPKFVHFDDAHARIPLPTQTGNLLARIPGRGARQAERPLLFMAHLDTVPLCVGAQPRISGRKVVNDAATALGGDNRTGCAVLVSLAAELNARRPDHPPLTLLFTVREESGLYGARHLNVADLGGVAVGFNFDGKQARDVIVGAVGADRWEVEVRGKAAHAGVAPQKGISATMVVALALAEVHAAGYFGKVVKGDRLGTSNVGAVSGPDGRQAGDATNVVTDYVKVMGESRSHDPKFVREITAAYKAAFANAAGRVTDDEGKPAKVKFTLRPDYAPFRLKESDPVVGRAVAAVKSLGMEPNLRVTNGGLDANWMAKHGVPTVTFGAGQHEIHTVKEWVDLDEFEAAVALAYALATG